MSSVQKLTTYFNDFLKNIALSDKQKKELQSAHQELRKWLAEDENTSQLLETSFLQGSYQRSTITKPDPGKKPDVDVIVVTNLDRERIAPRAAMDLFIPFLEKYYPGRWKPQGRSFGIELNTVDLDLVITALPDEATQRTLKSSFLLEGYEVAETEVSLIEGIDWGGYLWIPDRDTHEWQRTHPLAQIEATVKKNKASSGIYLGVVKTLKWWRKQNVASDNKIKSYPLEHMIWNACPDTFSCIPDGVFQTMSTFCRDYAVDRTSSKVPFLPDHGIPEHNVLKRISFSDFASFYDLVNSHILAVKTALESDTAESALKIWRELLVPDFPDSPKGNSGGGSSGGGFTPRSKKSRPSEGRFA